MNEQANLDVMKRAVQAFVKGDMAILSTLFAEDAVWHVPGRHSLAGEYRGRDAVFGFFGRLMELTGGTFTVHSIDMFANDAGGVFVDRVTAERNGKTLDVRLILHVTIRGGQIVEGVDAFHHEHLWDAFMA